MAEKSDIPKVDWIELEADEERLTRAVGLIVRRWAALEELIISETSGLQMTIRARYRGYSGHTFDDGQGVLPERSIGEFHPPVPRKTETRIRYLRRVVRALVPDTELARSFELALHKATLFYRLRNVVGHGHMRVDRGGVVEFRSTDTKERAERRRDQLERNVAGDLKAGEKIVAWCRENWDAFCGVTKIPLADLERDASLMYELHWEIRILAGRVPRAGPRIPPVQPPDT